MLTARPGATLRLVVAVVAAILTFQPMALAAPQYMGVAAEAVVVEQLSLLR